jgi:hypothetical protein
MNIDRLAQNIFSKTYYTKQELLDLKIKSEQQNLGVIEDLTNRVIKYGIPVRVGVLIG